MQSLPCTRQRFCWNNLLYSPHVSFSLPPHWVPGSLCNVSIVGTNSSILLPFPGLSRRAMQAPPRRKIRTKVVRVTTRRTLNWKKKVLVVQRSELWNFFAPFCSACFCWLLLGLQVSAPSQNHVLNNQYDSIFPKFYIFTCSTALFGFLPSYSLSVS